MNAERLYAMIGDMRREQEFYCAQPIFAEFVHAHEYDAAKKLNAELLEALEEVVGVMDFALDVGMLVNIPVDANGPRAKAAAAIRKAKGGAA